jgi:hypothetical protein
MSTLKLLIIMAVAPCLSISFYGCSSNTHSNNSNSSNTVETSKPVENTVYDVICVGVQSCLNDISKVPRGTNIDLYTKTESSVQQGAQVNLYIKTTQNRVEINTSEMEYLAKSGAKVYSFWNSGKCIALRVYNPEQGGFTKLQQKNDRISFLAGDITVDKKDIKPGPMNLGTSDRCDDV